MVTLMMTHSSPSPDVCLFAAVRIRSGRVGEDVGRFLELDKHRSERSRRHLAKKCQTVYFHYHNLFLERPTYSQLHDQTNIFIDL